MYQGKHVKKKTPPERRKKTSAEPIRRIETDERDSRQAVAVKTQRRPQKKVKKRRGLRKTLIILLAVLVVLGSMYSIFVFSNNSFIKKWRTIYIETAMSTMTHQWLATAFIPNSIIQEVMDAASEANKSQQDVSSHWNSSGNDNNDDDNSTDKAEFYKKFWELDETSFEEYLSAHPEVLENGYSGIVIDNLDCSDTSLKTIFDEPIRAINVPDNIIIMKVTGSDFVGALACVKDPEQVSLEKATAFGSYGELIEDFCKGNALAINASGFTDTGGVGNGGAVVGSYVKDGVEYGKPTGSYMYYGFKTDNRLYISWNLGEKSEYKWAMQFSPALVVNGESKVKGSYGWGMQPRAAIGQTQGGEMLMLIVDGRQVGYSVGCTVEDCANIMLQHKAYQAANLDGGSSAIMAYQGKIITKNSSKSSSGRTMPNAFVVSHGK